MKTAKDWIDAFDAGEVIESVSMGGMGNSYENGIQSCAVEIVRRVIKHDVPEDNDTFNALIGFAEDQATKLLNATFGFSGAQVGAAKNLASNIWRRGTDSFKDIPDRIIKIKRGERDFQARVIASPVEGETKKN